MGYRELRQALRDETRRQVAEIGAETARQAAEILEQARKEAARERAEALAAAEGEATEADGRADARLRLEEERLLLVEARRLLAELRAEAEARLPALLDAALGARLGAELRAEMDGPAFELRAGLVAVAGGRTIDNSLPARLRRAWPALEPELARALFGELP